MAKTNFSLLLSLSLTVLTCYSKPQASQPDQIIELFRHGARGPTNSYDQTWELNEWGVLTPVGIRQQYILGKVLSEKYPQTFGSDYDYQYVSVLTDTTPRCIQSATTQLFGTYFGTGPGLRKDYPSLQAVPPFQDARVQQLANSLSNNEAVRHNFIPGIVKIADKSNIEIFQGDNPIYCPNVGKWSAQNANDSKTQEAWTIFKDTVNNVNKHLDDDNKLEGPHDVMAFGDTVLVDLYDNRTEPGGIGNVELLNNVTYAASWFHYHFYHGQEIQRQLVAFNLINAVIEQLMVFREGVSYNKMVLLSGHDSNIYSWLAAFGVLNEDCIMANFQSSIRNETLPYPNCYVPYFASNIVLEFYSDTKSPYVKLYYNNAILPICQGKETCNYEDFLVFARNVTGNNTYKSYQQKCGKSTTEKQQEAKLVTRTSLLHSENFHQEKLGHIKLESLMLLGMGILCLFLFIKMIYNSKMYTRLSHERLVAANQSEISS